MSKTAISIVPKTYTELRRAIQTTMVQGQQEAERS
jgi:hypothetical protein